MKKTSVLLLVALFASWFMVFDAKGQATAVSPAPADAARTHAGPDPDVLTDVETIVLIRHGEKPANDQGQLTFQGLNRALALPDVLIKKFGKADFIFAPGTRDTIKRDGNEYSYIRPLITIEPTAIRLGLPVNAKFGYDDIEGLQKELLSPAYKNSLIFVAWEHIKLNMMVKNMLKALGGHPDDVPEWNGKDFDGIYVLKITTKDGKRSVTFQQDAEGLDGLSTEEPAAKGK